MSKSNFKRWGLTKLQVVEIIMPSYSEFYKEYLSNMKYLELQKQYLADIFRDIANAIMRLYLGVKDNFSYL